VLYDAVALVVSVSAAEALARDPTARDLVADAYALCKFIGLVAEADVIIPGKSRPASGRARSDRTGTATSRCDGKR